MTHSNTFPPYPTHNEVGIQVKPYDFGPPSLRPSGWNPRLQVFAAAHGRPVAGLGQADNMNAEGIETYPNELDLLAAADDVAGNGVFDPNGTHGNVHPDAGVFQDKQSLPGYIDREKFYSPSEVIDAASGQPVNYVPGGAVAFQEGQLQTYNDMLDIYQTPPHSQWRPQHLAQRSEVIPREPAYGVSGDSTTGASSIPTWGWLLIGVGVGAGASYLLKGKR